MAHLDWEELEEKFMEPIIKKDKEAEELIAKNDYRAFHDIVRNNQIEALEKQKRKGIKTGNVDRYGIVKHSKKMFPKARKNAEERLGLTRARELAEKKGMGWHPKLKITNFKFKKKDAVYVYDKDTRRRTWGLV